MTNETFYMIEKNQPCKGWAHSSCALNKEGAMIVHYSGGETLAAYQERTGKEYEILTWDQFSAKVAEYEQTLKGRPIEIDADRYDDALNVLPPGRWDGNLFFVIERITGNLVNWYFRKGDQYFEFIEDADAKAERLKEIINNTRTVETVIEDPMDDVNYVGHPMHY